MKKYNIRKEKYGGRAGLQALFLCLLFLLFSFPLQSQEELKRTYLKLSYIKKSDGNKYLRASISYKENKKFVPYKDAELNFYLGEDFDELIENVKTNFKGEAQLIIPENIEADSTGVFYFSAKFKGDEKLKRASKSLSVKDAILELSFNQKSEGRIIDVNAYELLYEEKVSISDEEIIIAVPTLFGNMTLGKASLEDGFCQIEFPDDLPGDSLGNLEIIAMIIDSEDYGDVEKKEMIPWGLPKKLTEIEQSGSKGKLWTYNAPIWMVVTLVILLTGVWSHFGYVIYKMYRINKEGSTK